MTKNRKLVVTGAAWMVALLMSAPIIWMVLTAFKSNIDAVQFPPKLFFHPTLGNFASANENVSLLRPVFNSIIESVGGTGLCFTLALPSAYALAFHGGKRRDTVLLGMLMTRFMPSIGIVIPMYIIFKALALIDTRFGLVLVYACSNLPIVVWMLYSYMREIPRDILDSSRIDGATTVQQLNFVLLPLCAPGIGSAALLSIILCWNEAFWSIQMTSSEAAPLSAYIATLSADLLWGQLSAASLLAVGPILLIGWVAQRHLVRGLTFGAVR